MPHISTEQLFNVMNIVNFNHASLDYTYSLMWQCIPKEVTKPIPSINSQITSQQKSIRLYGACPELLISVCYSPTGNDCWLPLFTRMYMSQVQHSYCTAVCVDPAKYLPKPKSANLKVVQMKLIMRLARLGFPWLISFIVPEEVRRRQGQKVINEMITCLYKPNGYHSYLRLFHRCTPRAFIIVINSLDSPGNMLTNNALYPWGTSIGKDKHGLSIGSAKFKHERNAIVQHQPVYKLHPIWLPVEPPLS